MEKSRRICLCGKLCFKNEIEARAAIMTFSRHREVKPIRTYTCEYDNVHTTSKDNV